MDIEEGVIDLDRVAHRLRTDHQLRAKIDMTGGGTATMYVGEVSSRTHGGDEDLYPEPVISVGPGWFKGPGWTNGRAYLDEVHLGPGWEVAKEVCPPVAPQSEDEMVAMIVELHDRIQALPEHPPTSGTLCMYCNADHDRSSYRTHIEYVAGWVIERINRAVAAGTVARPARLEDLGAKASEFMTVVPYGVVGHVVLAADVTAEINRRLGAMRS